MNAVRKAHRARLFPTPLSGVNDPLLSRSPVYCSIALWLHLSLLWKSWPPMQGYFWRPALYRAEWAVCSQYRRVYLALLELGNPSWYFFRDCCHKYRGNVFNENAVMFETLPLCLFKDQLPRCSLLRQQWGSRDGWICVHPKLHCYQQGVLFSLNLFML